MKHPDERVAIQAIEFWSTVCEEEVDLALEAQEVFALSILVPCLSEGFCRHKSMATFLRQNQGSSLKSLFLRLFLFSYNCSPSKRKTQMKMSGMLQWRRVLA